MSGLESMLKFLTLEAYEDWYKKEVSKNIDEETKLKIAKRISEMTLNGEAIWLPQNHYPKNMFPELAPYSHTSDFSGMQLYVVLTEIMRERGMNSPPASQIALKEKP